MAQKYNRNYTLYVETALGEVQGPLLPDQVRTIAVRPPFTLEFTIIRNKLADVNTAEINVYNLAPLTRDRIRKDQTELDVYRGVELWAGYGNPGAVQASLDPTLPSNVSVPIANEAARLFPRIFRGNISLAYSVRNGNNFITTIRAQDGGYASINANLGITFIAGTPIRQVLAGLIAALPKVTVGAIGNFTGSLLKANTFTGDPILAIKGIVEAQNGIFYIDGEKAFCIKPDEYVNGSIPQISNQTGIQGVPRLQNSILTVDMIFEPGLTIGQKVELLTRTNPKFNGIYAVAGLEHRGMISEAVCGSVITTAYLTNNPILTTLVGA